MLAFGLLVSTVMLLWAGPVLPQSCEIASQKRSFINAMLCGQAAVEREYRFSGKDCAKKSATARMEDSAIQIMLYRECGFENFSDFLYAANIRAMRFIEELQPCTGEKFSLNQVMAEAQKIAGRKLRGFRCTSSFRSKLIERKPSFQQMIDMALSDEITQQIYNKIGVMIEQDGSVVEQ
jgi:hypothetical protein